MPTAEIPDSFMVSSPESVLARRGPHVFFVLAASYAALILILWVVAYRLHWAEVVQPVMWHAHEMVYGFAAAGMAGLLMALVPAWSRARPCPEGRLALLTLIWVLGRVAMAAAGQMPSWLVATLDLSFIPAFALIAIVPHVAARPARNLAVLAFLAILFAGNLAMHAEAFGSTYELAERGARIGIDAYLLALAAIGGCAIPDATNRLFQATGSPAIARSFPLLDGFAVGAMALYLITDGVAGASAVTSAVALAAAMLNGARLWFWRGDRVLRAPSLLILHVGYLWIVVGLFLEAAAAIAGGVADMAALHVLAAGAIGTTLLGVVSRESLIHGGRGLAADGLTTAAYALVSLAVILRIAALFVPGAFVNLVVASGAVWALGFVVLLATYLRPAHLLSQKTGH